MIQGSRAPSVPFLMFLRVGTRFLYNNSSRSSPSSRWSVLSSSHPLSMTHYNYISPPTTIQYSAPCRGFHTSFAHNARTRGSSSTLRRPAVVEEVDDHDDDKDKVEGDIPPSTPSSRRRMAAKKISSTDDDDDELVPITRQEADALGFTEGEQYAPSSKKAMSSSSSSAAIAVSSSPIYPSDVIVSKKYIGVIREGLNTSLWEAVYRLADGREISGGEYESEEDAARAYDALARMYSSLSSSDVSSPTPQTPTNFPIDPYTAWLPPEAVLTTGQIETKPGIPLTTEEIVEALKQERGVNVAVVNLVGKSDLADCLVFVTGRSVPHMRKMADMVARALRKRRLPKMDAIVEARDMDDWMVVDCGNVIVSIMDEEAREVFDLENFWNNMKDGSDPYAGMEYEEWLVKNPIPDKWIKRLERDEAELERSSKLLQAPPQNPGGRNSSSSSSNGSGGGGNSASSPHFQAKLGKRNKEEKNKGRGRMG